MKQSPLLILFVTIFIDLFGFGLVLPLIPVYIQHYGGTPVVGGWLLACYSIMQFIFAPIWGRASDRYGRRPMILLGLIGSAASFLIFAAAGSMTVLFVARVAAGILTAASLPTAQAYIADVTPPEKRAGGMAMIGAAFGLGFAFGPWLGGLLGKYGLPWPAFFAAGLALINFVWAWFMLPESHHDQETEHAERGPLEVFPAIARTLRNPTIRAQILVFAFATFAFTAVESSFSWLVILRFKPTLAQMAAQASHYSPQAFAALAAPVQKALVEKAAITVTGGIFGIVGVTVLLTQLAVMRGLARWVGENRLVMFGTAILTAVLIDIGSAQNLNLIRLLSACIAIGVGVMNPSLSALITHAAGPRDRGTVSGAQQGLGSLARIIAPPINNSLIQAHTGLPFFCSSVLMGIAFLLSLRLRPLPHSETSEETGP